MKYALLLSVLFVPVAQAATIEVPDEVAAQCKAEGCTIVLDKVINSIQDDMRKLAKQAYEKGRKDEAAEQKACSRKHT